MNIIYFFIISLVNSKVIINNINIPVCKNCIHFIPNEYSDFSSSISKCNKFGDKDLKTDDIIFNYVDDCRSDINKCGKEGIYFEKEPNLQRKIFTHKFLYNMPYTIQVSFFVIFIYITFILRESR